MDDDGSNSLSFDEFEKAMNERGAAHYFKKSGNPNYMKDLFAIFDKDGNGTLDYEEFLKNIRVSVVNDSFIALLYWDVTWINLIQVI